MLNTFIIIVQYIDKKTIKQKYVDLYQNMKNRPTTLPLNQTVNYDNKTSHDQCCTHRKIQANSKSNQTETSLCVIKKTPVKLQEQTNQQSRSL